MESTFWRKCSSCKKPIGYRQTYQRCNVSTCNQNSRTSLVFCSVSCFSAHVPVLRHRDAWALEETSPSAEEWARENAAASETAPSPAAPRAPILVRPSGTPSAPALMAAGPKEILVVVSKLKAYIRERSEMNTSADVMDILSDKLRQLCDEAIRHAAQDGRKTVMARDF